MDLEKRDERRPAELKNASKHFYVARVLQISNHKVHNMVIPVIPKFFSWLSDYCTVTRKPYTRARQIN
jgi:hypothetical protein